MKAFRGMQNGGFDRRFAHLESLLRKHQEHGGFFLKVWC
jgi:hypothetical protein